MQSTLSAFTRLPRAVRNALRGLRTATQTEQSFQLQLVAAALAIPAALYLGGSSVERAALIAPVFVVLIVELLNSAIETAIDRIGAERHPLSRRAKDLAAAAALMSVAMAIGIWAIILYPKAKTLLLQ